MKSKSIDVTKAAKAKQAKLLKAARPLLKLLCSDYHPHHTVIITGTSIELHEGVCSIPKIYDYIKD